MVAQQRHRDEIRIQVLAVADAHIDRIAIEIDGVILDAQVQPDFRVQAQEIRHVAVEPAHTDRGDDTDRQTRTRAAAKQPFGHRRELVHHLGARRLDREADVGQEQLIVMTREQRLAKKILQLCDLLRYRTAGHVELARRHRDGAKACGGFERFDRVERRKSAVHQQFLPASSSNINGPEAILC